MMWTGPSLSRQSAPARAFASSYAKLGGFSGKRSEFEAGAGAVVGVKRVDGGVAEGWAQQESVPSQRLPAKPQVPRDTRQQETAQHLQVCGQCETGLEHPVLTTSFLLRLPFIVRARRAGLSGFYAEV
jgi:hypothetical protein